MNARTEGEEIRGLHHHHPYCKLLILMKVMMSPNMGCIGIPWKMDLVEVEDRCKRLKVEKNDKPIKNLVFFISEAVF